LSGQNAPERGFKHPDDGGLHGDRVRGAVTTTRSDILPFDVVQ